MVIIEGADRVGKTTLAKKIVAELNKLGWPHIYQHLGKLPTSWRHEPVSLHTRLMHPYVVWDRMYMSEVAYTSIEHGRTSMLSQSDVGLLDRQMRSFCGHTIVVSAQHDELEKRLTDREDEIYKVKQVLEVNHIFHSIAANNMWDGYHFCVDACETNLTGFPDITKVGLRAYTMRLSKMFPFHGAKVYGS